METSLINRDSREIREEFYDVITERGLKQKWIAEQLKVTPSYVSNLLNGHQLPFPESFRKRLNTLLGTDI